MPIEIIVPAEPSNADREAILRPLLAFNEAHGGPAKFEPLAVLLRDTTQDASLGGLWGQFYYDWLFIELLFVPAQLRGLDLGSSLLARAEVVARGRGCVGIWLDTFSFQAPGFYQKQGYEMFATFEDHPKGGQRFLFRKLLTDARL